MTEASNDLEHVPWTEPPGEDYEMAIASGLSWYASLPITDKDDWHDPEDQMLIPGSDGRGGPPVEHPDTIYVTMELFDERPETIPVRTFKVRLFDVVKYEVENACNLETFDTFRALSATLREIADYVDAQLDPGLYP